MAPMTFRLLPKHSGCAITQLQCRLALQGILNLCTYRTAQKLLEEADLEQCRYTGILVNQSVYTCRATQGVQDVANPKLTRFRVHLGH